MNFSDALELLKQGKRIRHHIWPGYCYAIMKDNTIWFSRQSGAFEVGSICGSMLVKDDWELYEEPHMEQLEIRDGLSFKEAMIAFCDGKEIKRQGYGRWLSITPLLSGELYCVELYEEEAKANDWMVKE